MFIEIKLKSNTFYFLFKIFFILKIYKTFHSSLSRFHSFILIIIIFKKNNNLYKYTTKNEEVDVYVQNTFVDRSIVIA